MDPCSRGTTLHLHYTYKIDIHEYVLLPALTCMHSCQATNEPPCLVDDEPPRPVESSCREPGFKIDQCSRVGCVILLSIISQRCQCLCIQEWGYCATKPARKPKRSILVPEAYTFYMRCHHLSWNLGREQNHKAQNLTQKSLPMYFHVCTTYMNTTHSSCSWTHPYLVVFPFHISFYNTCIFSQLPDTYQECLEIIDSCNLANVDELRRVIGTIGRRLRQRLPPDFYLYSRQQLRAAVRSKYWSDRYNLDSLAFQVSHKYTTYIMIY